MRCAYRQIVNNIELTKEEAQTLYDARKILKEATYYITASCCEYDKDLMENIKNAYDALSLCNPRLNVNLIVEDDEDEEF